MARQRAYRNHAHPHTLTISPLDGRVRRTAVTRTESMCKKERVNMIGRSDWVCHVRISKASPAVLETLDRSLTILDRTAVYQRIKYFPNFLKNVEYVSDLASSSTKSSLISCIWSN